MKRKDYTSSNYPANDYHNKNVQDPNNTPTENIIINHPSERHLQHDPTANPKYKIEPK